MATGREELIQANIARANTTTSVSPTPSTQGTKPPVAVSGGGYSSRNRMGANLDVVQTLKSIQFEKDANADGAMRGAIAYIRKWSRANSQQQSSGQVSSSGLFTAPSDFEWNSALATDLSNVIPPLKDPTSYYQPNPAQTPAYNPQEVYTTPLSQALRTRQQNLAITSPTSREAPTPSNVVATKPNLAPSSSPISPLTQGPLKAANPNGFLSSFISSFARNILPQANLEQKPVNQSWTTKFKGAALPEGMWQFLFNPSELELEAGPEFKSSETWAVSDKANSGQPLHWSHNKNAQLKFNSVLLNGYVFGRQVEDLEQGLFALFMSRDGEGQDGPPVLEFVWGGKIFGPCVIKNINVKEKQWDGGMVVNAELSFTLEQVPEWTINDGFVDVARPGRLATVNDPLQTGSESSTTESAPPAAPSGQKAQNPQPQPQGSQQYDFTQCKRVQLDIDFTKQLSNKLRSSVSVEPSFGSTPTSNYPKAKQQYEAGILDKYGKNPTYKPFFTTQNIPRQCLSPDTIATINTYNSQLNRRNNSEKYAYDKGLVEQLAACADAVGSGGGPIQALYKDKGCNRFQSNPGSNIERL